MTQEKIRSIGLIHFSDVTNKIHHCLCFTYGSRHLVPALLSQTHALVLVSHTSLASPTNSTLVCDTNGVSHMENVNNDEFYL